MEAATAATAAAVYLLVAATFIFSAASIYLLVLSVYNSTKYSAKGIGVPDKPTAPPEWVEPKDRPLYSRFDN